jgi:hypothetical protein
LIAFCWCLSGAFARAEQFSSPASKPGPVSTPIPLSEIASKAESTVGSVQSIETTLSTDQITATVEKRLPPLTREIELRGAEMSKYLAGSVPPIRTLVIPNSAMSTPSFQSIHFMLFKFAQ